MKIYGERISTRKIGSQALSIRQMEEFKVSIKNTAKTAAEHKLKQQVLAEGHTHTFFYSIEAN